MLRGAGGGGGEKGREKGGRGGRTYHGGDDASQEPPRRYSYISRIDHGEENTSPESTMGVRIHLQNRPLHLQNRPWGREYISELIMEERIHLQN